MLSAGSGSYAAIGVNEGCRGPMSHASRTYACDRNVLAGTVFPADRAGVESESSPLGNTRQALLAGGRPQLTTGIRAVSYAFKCSNPLFPESIQRLGYSRPQRRVVTQY